MKGSPAEAVCISSTQISHAAAASIGNARACLSVIIHAPVGAIAAPAKAKSTAR
jgi:hypothetical protein